MRSACPLLLPPRSAMHRTRGILQTASAQDSRACHLAPLRKMISMCTYVHKCASTRHLTDMHAQDAHGCGYWQAGKPLPVLCTVCPLACHSPALGAYVQSAYFQVPKSQCHALVACLLASALHCWSVLLASALHFQSTCLPLPCTCGLPTCQHPTLAAYLLVSAMHLQPTCLPLLCPLAGNKVYIPHLAR